VSRGPLIAALGALLGAAVVRAQQAVEITASRGGFRPEVVSAHVGDTVRLKLTTSDVEHCFALDALRIEKRVVSGRPTLVELTPERAGRFPFYCCLEGPDSPERGTLVVGE
jgi:cytochrome c oxidase subunit 2